MARHSDPRRGSGGTDGPWCGNPGVAAARIQWRGDPDEVGPPPPGSRVLASFSALSLSLPTLIQLREDGAAAGRRRGCVEQHGYEEAAQRRDGWVHELTDEEVLHYIVA